MKLKRPLILASNSPRRREIMHLAGYDFTVQVKPTDERFSGEMKPEEVPVFLAKKKAQCFDIKGDEIILCADTVVIVENEILNKPLSHHEAHTMLQKLSGRSHQVVTGVCIQTKECIESFSDTTTVHFKDLSDSEINYYIDKHKPFDKAGAYGVQDFIGMIGIWSIEGSFYTVMGLPIHKVYEVLKKYM